MTEGGIKNLTRAMKDGPAVTAGKALTAEAAWPVAEFPTAGAKTAAGTEAASNVAIFSESNIAGSSGNRKTSYRNRHYGKYRKNILFNPRPRIIRRAAAYE
jgi:hypothetical protein